MEKFVKIIATDTYACITQAEFDANTELYVDRSERPHYILKHYAEAGLTYWQARYEAKQLVIAAAGGFADFSIADKDALCIFAYGDQNLIVTHYVTVHSMSQSDATNLMVLRAAKNVQKLAVDAKVIAASTKMMLIGVNYLTVVDVNGDIDSSQAYNLTEAISDFKKQFEDYAVLGENYDDDHEGIMDYFESTNSYSSGGLKNYEFNPVVLALMPGPSDQEKEDQARGLMVGELQDLFVKGNA
jgi:hypothetical protein